VKFPKLFGKKGGDSDDSDDDSDEEMEDESEEESEDDDDDDSDEDGEKRPGGRRRRIIIAAAAVVGLGAAGGGAWYFLAGGDPAPMAKRVHDGPIAIFELQPRESALTPPVGGGLNAITAQEQGPGAGVMVPATTLAAFGNIPEAEPGEPLSGVPDPALIENGTLPKVGDDGRLPWKVYARPYDAKDDRPRIAIIISGMGLSQAVTRAAIKRLPGPVTLAFDPPTPRTWTGGSKGPARRGTRCLCPCPWSPKGSPSRTPDPTPCLPPWTLRKICAAWISSSAGCPATWA
jgi:hypothetical protein